jgi:hypothetical protein
MRYNEIIHDEKHDDVLMDDAQVIFLEGTTNAGKSLILGEKTIWRVLNAPEDRTQFVLAGKSLPVIEKMYIQNQTSFYNTDVFSAVCQYKNSGVGGARIEVQTLTGTKIIYLLGYDNKKRWSDILGLTIHGFNIEEITQADGDFISEVMLRVFRNGGWLICSSNGADPDIPVYTDHLNKARPLAKYADDVPKETWEELNRSVADDRFRYYFFNFEDNPTMTEQQKKDLIETTPKNSYQWMTKIIGIRGIREGVIYADYMSREKNIIKYSDVIGFENGQYIQRMYFERLTIGIDVGGTDYTVFTLSGFTPGYDKQIVIDYEKINNANHDKIWNCFTNWFDKYYNIYRDKIHGAFIDSAAKIMRLTFDERMRRQYNLQCVGAYKYTIKERVDMGIAFLDHGRIQFTEKAEEQYISFTKASYTTNKNKTDIREYSDHKHKDNVDSVEYSQSPFTKRMLRKR